MPKEKKSTTKKSKELIEVLEKTTAKRKDSKELSDVPKGKKFWSEKKSGSIILPKYIHMEDVKKGAPLFQRLCVSLYYQDVNYITQFLSNGPNFHNFAFVVDALEKITKMSAKELFNWFNTRNFGVIQFPLDCFDQFEYSSGSSMNSIPICEYLYEFNSSGDPYYLICIFKVISHLHDIIIGGVPTPGLDLSKLIKTRKDYHIFKNSFWVCAKLYFISKNFDVLDRHISKLEMELFKNVASTSGQTNELDVDGVDRVELTLSNILE